MEFEWRYEVKKKGNDNAEETGCGGRYEGCPGAPFRVANVILREGFYKEFVGVDLSQFVCLYNDASKAYRESTTALVRARNIAGDCRICILPISRSVSR